MFGRLSSIISVYLFISTISTVRSFNFESTIIELAAYFKTQSNHLYVVSLLYKSTNNRRITINTLIF